MKRSLIVNKKGHPPNCQMKLLKQTTTTNHHKPTANDHKLPQTTSKRPQTTTNHQQTTTNYHQTNTNYQHRPQTTTSAQKIKNLTFRFFFPHPVITRNTHILKNILFTVPNKWEGRQNNWAGADKDVKLLISGGS